jgi:hypothetical protein
MEYEFPSDKLLIKKVGVFINRTPDSLYRVVIGRDTGTGQYEPHNSISFEASKTNLREFAQKLLKELSLSSNLISKKVHPLGNEDKRGTIIGLVKASDTVRVVWHDGLNKSYEHIDDLVILD